MTTLYISDLDGTLLHDNQQVSPFSASVINRAVERGLLFSLATARSLIGLGMLDLQGIHWNTPLVLMNGVMLYDMASRAILQSCEMPPDAVAAVLAACAAEEKNPFLYRVEDGRLHACFTELTSEGERVFLAKRGARFPECFRQRPAYGEGAGVYFSLQDAYDRLDRIRDRLTALPGIACTLYKDNYMENNWYLEVFSAEAGKDKGARRLQALIGADRLVAFGDNSNDLPLFAAADVACCVASGRPDARAAADVIVAGNNDDGVARYLAALPELA